MDAPGKHLTTTFDEWRQHMGLTHMGFASYLGRDDTEWGHYRANRRYPTESFVRAARAKAAQYGGAWLRLIDDAIQQDALAKVAA
ncbi:MAG TPA: hypothetical protein VNM48_02405 [Chloroflexota bacterium]|nr:hypothetical protein [Chloroflexota bacterium]